MSRAAFLKSNRPLVKCVSEGRLFGNNIFRLHTENECHTKMVGIVPYIFFMLDVQRQRGSWLPACQGPPWPLSSPAAPREAWADFGLCYAPRLRSAWACDDKRCFPADSLLLIAFLKWHFTCSASAVGFINILFFRGPRARPQAERHTPSPVYGGEMGWGVRASWMGTSPWSVLGSGFAQACVLFSSGCLAACELNKGDQEASAGGWCQLYSPSVGLPFLFPSRDKVSLSPGKGSTWKSPQSRLPWSHSHHSARIEPMEHRMVLAQPAHWDLGASRGGFPFLTLWGKKLTSGKIKMTTFCSQRNQAVSTLGAS